MRRPVSERDLAWVVEAKAHDTRSPSPGSFPDEKGYLEAFEAWWAKRMDLVRTAPTQRVTAAEVAAYEATKGQAS